MSVLKIHLIIRSIITVIVLFILNLAVLPQMIETFEELQMPVQPLKEKIFVTTMGLSMLIFLLNFYFWKIDNTLKREEWEMERVLRTNPGDSIIQRKLEEIKRKRERYLAIIDPIFVIILGAIIGFMAVSIVQPLYRFLGTM